MASMFLRPLIRSHVVGGVGLGLCFATFQLRQQRHMRLDSGSPTTTSSYQMNQQMPLRRNGHISPRAVRQITSGSIIGLCAGLAVSTFSKSLALLIGLLVVGVQWAASYGINVLPYKKVQKYVTDIDLKSALQDNMAFKMSFGTTFALAAFMHL